MPKNNDIDTFIYENFLKLKLNGVVRYYNESKRLANNEVVYIKREIDKNNHPANQRELAARKEEYMGWFRELLIQNCFLLLYSHLEETLAIILRASGPSGNTCSGSSIGRFKEPYQSKYKIEISTCPNWYFITNCSKVRHLILHANGNISLAKDPNEAQEDCRRLGSDVLIKGPKIALQESILQKFSDAIFDMTTWLLSKIEEKKV